MDEWTIFFIVGFLGIFGFGMVFSYSLSDHVDMDTFSARLCASQNLSVSEWHFEKSTSAAKVPIIVCRKQNSIYDGVVVSYG